MVFYCGVSIGWGHLVKGTLRARVCAVQFCNVTTREGGYRGFSVYFNRINLNIWRHSLFVWMFFRSMGKIWKEVHVFKPYLATHDLSDVVSESWVLPEAVPGSSGSPPRPGLVVVPVPLSEGRFLSPLPGPSAIGSPLTPSRAPERLVLCVQRTSGSFHVMWVRHCQELNGLSLGSSGKEIAGIFLVPEGGITQNLKIQTTRRVKAPSEKLVHLLDSLH